jgi:hypothetical protein
MHSRTFTGRIRKAAAIAGPVVLVLAMASTGAFASHPEASLPGSNFEIDVDANLKVDDAGSLDWANVTEARAVDKPTGSTDDSYQGGVKEDTSCPGETTGSIPNNKSDLRTFHVYREDASAGNQGFLNLGWSRVTDPSGTTLMDFEFNQSSTNCTSGPNKQRTTGDLLIEYTIDQGGARANITGRTWNGSAWGPAADLDVPSAVCGGNPCAAGTINSSSIPAAESDGIISTGSLAPRTFGEAQIDIRYFFQSGSCTSFGSAMLKSRSSDAFTSQLKDFIRPLGINISNCGQVIIRKETIPDGATAVFGYTKSFGTDPASTNTFNLSDGQNKSYTNVLFGSGYTVDETTLPANWAFVSVDCSASTGVTPTLSGSQVTFAIDAPTDVLDCTYTNQLQLGALKIVKNSTKGGAVTQAGAVFSYNGTSVTDNGAGDQDGDIGEVCVSGLSLGDYTVDETTAPPGYGDDSGGSQTVTVVAGTNCTDNQPTGAAVATFTNAPLADIQVSFRDGGSGETSLVGDITCTNTGVDPSRTAATDWDASATYSGIKVDPSPRTVTCTIVIDP